MSLTDKFYKLKEDETDRQWMKALCARLNKSTEGIKYVFREWGNTMGGCRIDTRPQGKRYQVSIDYKRPRYASQGDIASVNVHADEIYNISIPRLNRGFKVSPDGRVNIAKLHKCVQERIAIIEEHIENQKQQRLGYDARKKQLKETLKGTGIKAEHYGDRSGLHLTRKDQDFNANMGTGNVSIRLGHVTVPFERVDAFFKAWSKLEEAIKGDDDENWNG